ncbi:MAG: helix-turn-helix domain-containing protein [Egibacteraceae bacterium]
MVVVVVVWTGLEARALRTALRMSVLKFAEYLGVGSRTVSDWEAGGAEIVPTPVMQEALDTALSRACDEAKIRFVELTSGNPVVCVPDSPGHNGNGAHTDRRQAGKAIVVGGLAAALAPREALERITLHGDRPVDSGLLTAHEDFADWLASLHPLTRLDDLLDLVSPAADTLLRLLRRPMSSTDRSRLEVVTVGACAQAGMLAFGIGDWSEARHHFALAQNLAHESADATLVAQSLAVASMLCSSIPSGGWVVGRDRRSVKLLRAALRQDDSLAWVHQWLAEELAAVDEERAFRESLEAAERFSSQRPSQRDRHGFFARYFTPVVGAEDLARSTGTGLVRLGRGEEALAELTKTLDRLGPRGRAVVLAETASAWVIQGEPEQACRDLQHALDLALDAGYTMGVERIRGVRARFPKPWAELACVQELDERLALAG